jgi:hypothetical protein
VVKVRVYAPTRSVGAPKFFLFSVQGPQRFVVRNGTYLQGPRVLNAFLHERADRESNIKVQGMQPVNTHGWSESASGRRWLPVACPQALLTV